MVRGAEECYPAAARRKGLALLQALSARLGYLEMQAVAELAARRLAQVLLVRPGTPEPAKSPAGWLIGPVAVRANLVLDR
jgi:hypothetical protein